MHVHATTNPRGTLTRTSVLPTDDYAWNNEREGEATVVPNCRCGPKKLRRLEPLTLAKCGLSRSSTGIRRHSSCDYPALQSLRIAPPTPTIAREHQMPRWACRDQEQRSEVQEPRAFEPTRA